MITKIYLNFPLVRVPLNGLVRFNGCFYLRRTRNAGRVYLRSVNRSYVDISVPSSILVQYYKER